MADDEHALPRTLRTTLGIVAAAVVLLCVPSGARADGIDIGWFLTHVGGWRDNPTRSVFLALGLLIFNYFLNMFVIGNPAARASTVSHRTIATDMISFTLIAQVIDRLFGFLGLFLGIALVSALGVRGEASLGAGFMAGLGFNFVLSGVGVGLLARRYMTRRWNTPNPPAKAIAIRGGIFTNPAWAIGIVIAMNVSRG